MSVFRTVFMQLRFGLIESCSIEQFYVYILIYSLSIDNMFPITTKRIENEATCKPHRRVHHGSHGKSDEKAQGASLSIRFELMDNVLSIFNELNILYRNFRYHWIIK